MTSQPLCSTTDKKQAFLINPHGADGGDVHRFRHRRRAVVGRFGEAFWRAPASPRRVFGVAMTFFMAAYLAAMSSGGFFGARFGLRKVLLVGAPLQGAAGRPVARRSIGRRDLRQPDRLRRFRRARRSDDERRRRAGRKRPWPSHSRRTARRRIGRHCARRDRRQPDRRQYRIVAVGIDRARRRLRRLTALDLRGDAGTRPSSARWRRRPVAAP